MIKKVIWPGLLAGIAAMIAGFVVSMLMSRLFPSLAVQYETSGIFRPWTDPKMSIYFAYPFLLGLGLAYVWDKIKGVITGGVMKRALMLTLGCFVVSTVPGMTITYSSFTVSLLMVASWTVSGIVSVFCVGLVLAKMNG